MMFVCRACGQTAIDGPAVHSLAMCWQCFVKAQPDLGPNGNQIEHLSKWCDREGSNLYRVWDDITGAADTAVTKVKSAIVNVKKLIS